MNEQGRILKHSWILVFLISLLLAFAVGYVIYYATAWGPIAYSDSVGYITSARNLVEGNGLGITWGNGRFYPLKDHPPLYSLFLALGALFKFPLIGFSRWTGIILGGASALCISLSSYYFTRRISFFLLVSLFWVSPPLIIVSLFNLAMSEVLFYPLLISSIFLVFLYTRKNQSWQFISGAICVGLASVTHIMGIPFIVASSVFIFFFAAGKIRKRILISVCYLLIALLFCTAWLIYIYIIDKSIAGRTIYFDPNWWQYLGSFRASIINFLWEQIPFVANLNVENYNIKKNILSLLFIVFIILTLLASVYKLKKKQEISTNAYFRWGAYFGISVFMYLFFLTFIYLFSTSASDILLPNFPFNNRNFSYLYLCVFFSLFGFIYFISDTFKGIKWLKIIPMVSVLSFYVLYSSITISSYKLLHRDGQGYLSRNWITSPIIESLDNFPLDYPIISNEPEALLLLTDRRPYTIYEIRAGKAVDPFTRFGDGDTDAEIVFRNNGAVLVLFPSVLYQFERIYGSLILADERINIFVKDLFLYESFGSGGAIYFWDQ